ncbi:peptidoglycan DD-metalloendopeptidase family protein [Candidatus Falkowbacteria bacterium]|nr:peptidoglycan DD-metalloendopeptidase family protein [Candidatus Falkowbacteria bacterium]
MKKVLMVALIVFGIWTEDAYPHEMYVKKNPTNENGIEFGVNNASDFVRWRAYVKGVSNNGQGENTGWSYANGWWYYEVSSISQRVMWRTTGLQNQKFVVTYWVFKSDGTWEYGPQVEVISDTQLPTANFTNLFNGTVYQQSTFNITVSSSDNLSGVQAIRIYVFVPSGLSMSGWTPSGLSGQYYLEFSGTSINYNFTAPGEGLYTFTLWVKDKAGNIAYEPGGPVSVGVDLPDQPATKYSCNSSNGICSASSSGNYSSLADCQNNCSAPAVKYICNTVNYTCSQSASGTYSSLADCQSDCVAPPPSPRYACDTYTGTCTQSSLGLFGSLADCQNNCVIAPPVDDYKYAEHFIYPMACQKIYRLEADSQIPIGACFDYQPFGSLFAYSAKIHLGADLNLKGVNDLGAPLYAIANALIYDLGWTSGWGNYLILQITAKPDKSFYLPSGKTATQIYVLYGHLNEIKIVKDDGTIISQSQIVKKSTYVKGGWQIGTVGDGNGNYSPHLHFEIRINGYDQLGPGYWPVSDYATYLNYWVDPIQFIENNMAVFAQKPLSIFINAYDEDAARPVHVELDTTKWQRQGRVNDGLPLAAVGNANHVWLLNTDNDKAASWCFSVPMGGAYSLYAIIPRYYATAKNVRYRIWHSRQNMANPYETSVDQSNDNVNKTVYLGTYDYYANTQYSVDVFSKTSDNPVRTVAFDTLIVVYEGDYGSGGGNLPPPPLIDDCGNGYCDSGEDSASCPADCSDDPPIDNCGNGFCDDNETSFSCSADCTITPPPSYCGDGNCDNGETANSCPADCYVEPPNKCGNGVCDNGETSASCPSDCQTNPPPPPPTGGGNDDKEGDNGNDKSIGGCQVMPMPIKINDILAFWLVIFSPLLLPLLRKIRK